MARSLRGRLVDLDTHFTDELYPQYKRSPDTWYIHQDIRMSSHCGTHGAGARGLDASP
jgi:hypothetical protein